ncbi:outer membrane protein assembly factor BamB [Natrinema hispanicum]|uniref:Outer membrane protein assembly factor BamB n=1 Tax=Natrinema hispanicum TaxID=392421 RepID=A0A482Y1I6_9EURY|nr:PQQ-binding-like beta-propeller repeat protein [Natrinema hispanicum]RZV05183.1 outer membrane protein assembly factor BamB [Natrinema hispanicum]
MVLRRREMLSSGIVTLCGCTTLRQTGRNRPIQGPTSWVMYGRGPTHQASYEDGTIPFEAPSTDQSFSLSGSVATSPVASENYLAVGDEQDILVVPFDSRELPRRIEPPGTVAGTPCLDGQTVIVTSDGRRGKVDTARVSAITIDKEVTWQTNLSANIVTSPTVQDGAVFVRSSDKYIALDIDSGKTRWQNSNARQLSGVSSLEFENFGPAVGDDVVIFPDKDGITAMDPTNGTIRWQHQLQKVRACPVIAGKTVYVADVKSGIYAFDIETGDRKWKWAGTGCWSPPIVSNGNVFTTEVNDIVALDQATGELGWRTQKSGLHGSVQSGLSVVGDTILASSSSLGLVSVNANSDGASGSPGTKRWTLGSRGYNTPIVVDDFIAYVNYGVDNPTVRIVK